MDCVELKPLYHRGSERIGIFFWYNSEIEGAVRRLKDVRWSRTHRCWYVLLNNENYRAIKEALAGKAALNTTALKSYLEQRQAVLPVLNSNAVSKQRSGLLVQYPLGAENLQAYQHFTELLKLKGYSPNTLRSYCGAFHQFLRILKAVPANSLSRQHIHAYLLWLLEKKGASETQVHTVVNALKFYFEQVEKRPREFYDLPRPKKPQKLPPVLSEKEVARLISNTNNLKHRALLMTSYSAGLRVSELVKLKLTNIDSDRMTIHVQSGKGKKDRMVALSETLLEVLRAYYKVYKPAVYLFESDCKGVPYSTRSAQEVLRKAKAITGIFKKGSIHLLRHAYATHLLEAGTDVRYIQELLGHKSLSTTMLYTHVAQRDTAIIKSPLDRLKM